MHLIAQSSTSSSPLSFLIFLLPLGLLFFLMRSQRKRVAQQTQVQHAAEVGDEILTTSGMFGTVIAIDDDDDTVTVEIAPGTRVKMVRSGIGRLLTEDDDDDEDSAWDEGGEEADSPS
jgi:preprotein translocase subunit YajC